MPVRLNSSAGGSVTLDVPATAGTFTVNLPAANGDVVVTGGGSTVQFGAGSAAAPSITFSGDTNTGIYSPAADTIAFAEGGVEAMRLNASGQLTITSQPSFRVSRSNNLGVSGVVLFDNIYHNIGSHYNSGTGRFTAPVTGSYLLTATGGHNSAYGFDIRVNGTSVSRAELVGVSFGYLWKTCSVVVRMNANDYADVNVFSGTSQFEPNFGSFTGQLLS